MEWGVGASLQIGAQRSQIANYRRHSVADWNFRGDLPSLRDKFRTDYVLFTVFKQTRETDGQKLGRFLSGSTTVGKQIDSACIADLRDGNMVWCSTKTDDRDDLAEDGQMRTVLTELLGEVFRIPGRGESVERSLPTKALR